MIKKKQEKLFHEDLDKKNKGKIYFVSYCANEEDGPVKKME